MKVHLLKDKKGRAIASINHTNEDANLVPLDIESDDGCEVEEIEVRSRDLWDIDKFYEKTLQK